jgi:AcrR family transcriptional regulator
MAARPRSEPDPAGDRPVSLREQQKLYTRQRLTEAALEVFDRQGYVSATIEDIVATAGASRATFYLHFRGKNEVVRDFLARLTAESFEIYRSLDEVASGYTWQEMRAWVTQTVTFWDRNRALVKAVGEAVAVEPDLAEAFVDSVERTVDVMTNYLESWSGADRAAARLRATLLILQLERFCFFWKVQGVDVKRTLALDAITDMWWHAFKRVDDPVAAERPADR